MIDSHAHVAFEQFDDDRDEVISRAQAAGVSGWVEIGTDVERSRKAIGLAEQHENVWATAGVHPSDIDALDAAAWDDLGELARHPKVKAIGEVGLDLYRGGDLEKQTQVLRRFIELAQERDLPLVFHIRSGQDIDLHEEMIGLLAAYSDNERPSGVMHTFSGTASQAMRYVELGMYISFSGVVTFKNAEATVETARSVPAERILIETDCPFLAPDPYRGQRCELAYVELTAKKVADVRGVPVEELQRQTEENTKKLFALV